MIFVRRDPALIPEKVLRVAERAQQTLEALPPDVSADVNPPLFAGEVSDLLSGTGCLRDCE